MLPQAEMIGHERIREYLDNCLIQGRLAHAYLFLGPNGAGRMKLAALFASRLVGAKDLNHPDLKILRPEKDLIAIESIRLLREWLVESPIASKRKAVIIEDAEKMKTEAQNAFLKILEEPARETYIFLLANHRRSLLATIYSRTVPIYFNPVPAAVIRAAAPNKEIVFAHGRPGALLTATDPAAQANAELFRRIISAESRAQRLRLWLTAKIEKDATKDWLKSILPEARTVALGGGQTQAKAVRALLAALSQPVGKNWPLIAENLLLSL